MRVPGIVLLSALISASLAVAAPGPVMAEPTPTGEPAPGKKLCKFSDQRLSEISGLAATEDGYTAVADGGDVLQIFDLSRKCTVKQAHTFQQNPFDPEDLAITEDGTVWVADIGDNNLERETVALWKIASDRSSASIYRMTYPDGEYDAEALLMQPDGKPVIVTKDLDGAGVARIYIAKSPLKEGQSVPLTKAGELKLASTGTAGNRFGVVGQKLVTGGTVSADGTRAVLRTYSDAYEWKVAKGDVVAALTKAKPRPVRTPLPGEGQGEAITLSRDGTQFITATEAVGQAPAAMFSYTPNKPAPPKPKPRDASGPGWFSGLDLGDIKMIIAALGVLGLVLVVLGVWGIKRSRAALPRRPGRSEDDDGAAGPPPTSRRRRRAEPDDATAELNLGDVRFDDLRHDPPGDGRDPWGTGGSRRGPLPREEPWRRGEPPVGRASRPAPRPRPSGNSPRARYPDDDDDTRYHPPAGGGWPPPR
ncbi:MAG: hypothetical protein GEU94_16910 [Micromonosporaceae bacterium]|nr:hypothetical protein [Micromonosporaceae bacterium]